MTATDAVFAGSIPAIYERYLVPMLFEPFARDLADRIAGLGAKDILETAAGTGVVTAMMAESLPDSRITATDLNQAMLDVAAQRISSANVTFQAADAQALPFADASFDAVVCQFGVMFFPDRIAAYREACRVLKPGGAFLFNSWDRIDRNPGSDQATAAVAALFPDNSPAFLRRVPFGYHDWLHVEADLREAGFETIEAETVEKTGKAGSARDAATGLCQGTPLRTEIETHGEGALEAATEAVASALAAFEGPNGFESPMSAHLFRATR